MKAYGSGTYKFESCDLRHGDYYESVRPRGATVSRKNAERARAKRARQAAKREALAEVDYDE